MNAVVFGISVDSVFTLKKYKEEQQLNFPLASDYNKEVSTAFGTLYALFNNWMKGVSKRSAFIIDDTDSSSDNGINLGIDTNGTFYAQLKSGGELNTINSTIGQIVAGG